MTARPRWALVAGLALLGVTLLLTALFKGSTGPLGVDRGWHDLMVDSRQGALTSFAEALSFLGGPFSLVITLGLLAWLLATRRWGGALLLFAVTFLANGLAQLVKHFVLRPRPADPLVHVDTGSFPSGHMVTTLSLAIVLLVAVRTFRRNAWIATLVVATLVMMWDRTYLSAHWISDTVSGAILGSSVTLLLWWSTAPLLARDTARRAARRAGPAEPAVESATA